MTMCIKNIILSSLLLLPTLAMAESGGRTADGCSYRVINGKYLTDCSGKKEDPKSSASTAIVESYDSVPMRYNPQAPVSAPNTPAPSYTPQNAIVVDRAEIMEQERIREKERFREATYLGANLSSTTLNTPTSDSSIGIGANLGTNLDNFFGVELGYAYSQQDANLGLAARDGSTLAAGSANDTSLSTHLVTAELQGHFTGTYARLRPYLGAGLGWKISSLEEKNNTNYAIENTTTSSTLSQQSVGALATGGAKLRAGKSVNVLLGFRYFIPLQTQQPKISVSNSNSLYLAQANGRLTKEDSALTDTSLYQFLAGVQYVF